MDIETLKNDLIANSRTYDNLIAKRNSLNIEIFRMEGIVIYIKALINSEEQKAKVLVADKLKEEEVKEKEEGGEEK